MRVSALPATAPAASGPPIAATISVRRRTSPATGTSAPTTTVVAVQTTRAVAAGRRTRGQRSTTRQRRRPGGTPVARPLIVAAIGGPLAAGAVAGKAETRIAPVRGGLAAAALDLLQAAPELVAAGTERREIARVAAASADLERAEARSAAGAGIGVLLTSLSSGAAVWLALVAAIVAVRSGSLGSVALAVVVLLPMAAHELVAGLAPAAQHLARLRSMAERLGAVLDRPDPVADPDAPQAPPPVRTACGSTVSMPATKPTNRMCSTALTSSSGRASGRS